jgi:hypothetical protein
VIFPKKEMIRHREKAKLYEKMAESFRSSSGDRKPAEAVSTEKDEVGDRKPAAQLVSSSFVSQYNYMVF